MFTKILIANRGENGPRAVSAKPHRMAHAVRAGDLTAEA